MSSYASLSPGADLAPGALLACALLLCAGLPCAVLACGPSATTAPPPVVRGGPEGQTMPARDASATLGSATGSVAGTASMAESVAPPEIQADDCPPRCSQSGAWVGCGLDAPRGDMCGGCVPRCRAPGAKGGETEGWYDCRGVLIAAGKCG